MPRGPKTSPRKSAQQDRSRATVESIVRATARILVREGYDGASTNKIALMAGVSIGSLYQYFPSKEALVAELFERHCAEIVALLAESASRYADAPLAVAVRSAIEAQVRAHRIDPALHRVLFEQIPRIGRIDRMKELHRATAEMVEAYLDEHRADLRVKDTAVAAMFVVRTVETLTHLVVFDHSATVDEARAVDEITDVVVRYLAKDS